MQDKELYRQLLGLEWPWEVSEVGIDLDKARIDVWIRWPGGGREEILCPECKEIGKIHDYREERQWRHLDTMQFQTILHCRVPRVECLQHGVKTIDVPWSEKHSHFTALFERLGIGVLLACQNQTKAKQL